VSLDELELPFELGHLGIENFSRPEEGHEGTQKLFSGRTTHEVGRVNLNNDFYPLYDAVIPVRIRKYFSLDCCNSTSHYVGG